MKVEPEADLVKLYNNNNSRTARTFSVFGKAVSKSAVVLALTEELAELKKSVTSLKRSNTLLLNRLKKVEKNGS